MDSKKIDSAMRFIWERAGDRMAHLGERKETRDLLHKHYKEELLAVEFEGKRIIDFGCGGAMLGKYIFKAASPKCYIGYDISKASLNGARKNLKGLDPKKISLVYLDKHAWDFKARDPDLIIALSVIIHFPFKSYLDNFLQSCNESGANELILMIRDTGEGVKFQERPYRDRNSAIFGCVCNEKYITENLDNYFLVAKRKKNKESNCQVLKYWKK